MNAVQLIRFWLVVALVLSSALFGWLVSEDLHQPTAFARVSVIGFFLFISALGVWFITAIWNVVTGYVKG
jgi:hypothetical protein